MVFNIVKLKSLRPPLWDFGKHKSKFKSIVKTLLNRES